MAEQTFRYQDDELLVVADGDRVRFITRGHDQEELDHDQVRELIGFLQEIVGEGMTAAQMDNMEPGDCVVDGDGDTWTRDSDGDWYCHMAWRSATASEVVDNHGPVRRVGQ